MNLSPEKQAAMLAMIERELAARQLDQYGPYGKQREFHRAGASFSERLFMAGNQLGKTKAGGAEWAMHLTGRYPDWWDGAAFAKPVTFWAGSVTSEATRDNPQRMLLGPPATVDAWGTGMVPRDAIKATTRAMGVANLLDSAVIRWGGGGDVQAGESIIAFKSYEKGREKWQGPTVDGVWFDEEPPQDIYAEGLTRTNNGQRGQFAQTTFTPLLGMSDVVMRFLMPEADDPGAKARHVTSMTIWDVDHYTLEQKQSIVASYPAHEREARSKGIPTLGSGRIFPVEEDSIKVQPFPIPAHWVRINGLDFGWDHPTAAVQLAWDRDSDCLYVIQGHRQKEATPILHAATQGLGRLGAHGMASRRPAARQGQRRATGRPVCEDRAEDAQGSRHLRGWQQRRRGRPYGDAAAHADRTVQGVRTPGGLVQRVPPVPPRGRQGREEAG